jgi:hypothetical protein
MSSQVYQELKTRARFDPILRRKLAAHPLQFLANFDLSFDEKRQLVLPRLDTLTTPIFSLPLRPITFLLPICNHQRFNR